MACSSLAWGHTSESSAKSRGTRCRAKTATSPKATGASGGASEACLIPEDTPTSVPSAAKATGIASRTKASESSTARRSCVSSEEAATRGSRGAEAGLLSEQRIRLIVCGTETCKILMLAAVMTREINARCNETAKANGCLKTDKHKQDA